MSRRAIDMESPIGSLRVVAEDGALVGVYMEAHAHQPVLDAADGAGDPLLVLTREQLGAWFLGQRRDFDLPLRPRGSPFQLTVWQELMRIPYGETRTYGEIARSLGRPEASRAVGAANGRNPLSIVVPCHRVVGADGSLTGYGGGLKRKRWLLEHERAVVERASGFRLA